MTTAQLKRELNIDLELVFRLLDDSKADIKHKDRINRLNQRIEYIINKLEAN